MRHGSSGGRLGGSTLTGDRWFPRTLLAVELPDAVFHVDGDIATPTELARGPWSPHAQHGGAPASLLAGLLERFDPGPATFPARLTVELMRPVPLAPLRIEAQTIRPGKKVQLVQGSLFAGHTEVVRATLLRLREQVVEFDTAPVGGPPSTMAPPGPAGKLPGKGGPDVGFWDVVEMSTAHGEFLEPGPAGMWIRLAVPVVAGEATSPLQRVAAASDFGNGLSAAFGWDRYSCINADLTITLHRLPGGEWVGLDSVTYPERTGFGMAESVLHDEQGRIGRAVQAVLIEER
jgi:Acyl-CoA thioesterase C-terminal domain/Acyl-CoA thioesterase N-terminal domain